MDLESASVQKALSKKFPRKRCFKEVSDCLGQPEKIARTNIDTETVLYTAAPAARNEKQLECDLTRLRSLSPGNHDIYEEFGKLKGVQYAIGVQPDLQNRQLLYGNPCSLGITGRSINHNDFDAEPMINSLLTAKKYISPNSSLLNKNIIDIKCINHNSNQLTNSEATAPNVKNFIQRARTIMPTQRSAYIRSNSSDMKYENAADDMTGSLLTMVQKPYPSTIHRQYSHIKPLNDQLYKNSYLSPLRDLPCSSPINYSPVMNEITNCNPMCLRTASTVIVEAMSNRVCCNQQRRHRSEESESDQCSRNVSINSSPTSSKSSIDSTYSRQQIVYKQRYKNAFQSAHRDLLGGTSIPSYSPVLGEPPELIRISSDDGDYADDSPSESEGAEIDDSEFIPIRQIPDTSCMSVDEILGLIRLPNLSQFTADLDGVKSFLVPHQIGHINHLIKCYADAIFTINIPPTVFESTTFSAVDYVDIHMTGVLQIYSIMFKSEDFLSLGVTDQVTLLQSCVLPAQIALGFPLYKPEKNAWTIPSAITSDIPFTYGIYNMLQVLPKSEVSRLVALHETSHKLNIDWTISVLLLFIFMFTPIKRKIFDMENIENIRNTYVQLLYKYLEWKCGPQNAQLVFPEILKLMDAILRLCQDLEDFELWLKEEEVEIVQARIKCFSLQGISPFEAGISEDHIKLIREDPPMEYVSYSNIHSRMSSVLLKSCCAAPSETVSSDSESSFRIPCKMPTKQTFMDSYENSELAVNKIRQFQNSLV